MKTIKLDKNKNNVVTIGGVDVPITDLDIRPIPTFEQSDYVEYNVDALRESIDRYKLSQPQSEWLSLTIVIGSLLFGVVILPVIYCLLVGNDNQPTTETEVEPMTWRVLNDGSVISANGYYIYDGHNFRHTTKRERELYRFGY